MSREWKAGDVAMSDWGRVMRAEFAYKKGAGWVYDDGSGAPGNDPGALRPLVVIDPEDREAVERLADYLDSAYSLEYAQHRLREYANPKPPKPDEPQGLGAVVEDIHGRRYQRVDRDPAPWLRSDIAPDAAYDWRDYDQINAVRVLSPGVEMDQ